MSATAQLAPLSLDIDGPYGHVRVRYAFDLTSQVQRDMHAALDRGAFYEPATSRLFLSILKPGDTFIDIGAHIGYFSMLAAAAVGDTGEVISFEPSPDNYRQLVEHVALNGFTNVLPFQLALGTDERVTALHLNADNDGGHALWNVGLHPANHLSRQEPRVHPVYVARLDRVLRGRPMRSVKAIKIDVEGSEVLALTGAAETIARHQIPFVVAEVNRMGLELLGTSEQALRQLMKAHGYEVWVLQDGDPELFRLEDTQTVGGPYVFNLLFRRPGSSVS